MSLLEHEQTSNDAELISQVRAGDLEAYGELFARHKDAATRLARSLVHGAEAEDLVSDAFAKVLNVLMDGGGPDVAFRAYLLTAVRRLHIDKIRSQRRATPTDDFTPYDDGVPFSDTAISGFEGGAAAKAFASLPERWQLVLWHLEVENQKPADIAPLLGMSANSVSALAYRAREGLRQAFLNQHAHDAVEDTCLETNELLGAYVRGALSKRDTVKVEGHLENCRKCTAAYLELADVNTSIGAVIGPVILGTAALGYMAATAGQTAGIAGVSALVGRVRDTVAGNAGATAAAAAATVVVAGAAVAGTLALTNNNTDRPTTNTNVGSRTLDKSTGKTTTQPSTPQAPPAAQVPAPAATDIPTSSPIPFPETTPSDDPGPTPSATTTKRPARPTSAPAPAPSAPPTPSASASATAGATTGASPTPSPSETPTGTPTPTETPSETPTEPALPEGDASVTLTPYEAGGAGAYVAKVSGVPSGGTATVVIEVPSGNLNPLLSPSCSTSGQTITCTTTDASASFIVTRVGGGTSTLTAVLSAKGYKDTNSANDRAEINVG